MKEKTTVVHNYRAGDEETVNEDRCLVCRQRVIWATNYCTHCGVKWERHIKVDHRIYGPQRQRRLLGCLAQAKQQSIDHYGREETDWGWLWSSANRCLEDMRQEALEALHSRALSWKEADTLMGGCKERWAELLNYRRNYKWRKRQDREHLVMSLREINAVARHNARKGEEA